MPFILIAMEPISSCYDSCSIASRKMVLKRKISDGIDFHKEGLGRILTLAVTCLHGGAAMGKGGSK
jgi:hypothetical protein